MRTLEKLQHLKIPLLPSNGSSIGAQVLELAKNKSWLGWSVEEMLGAHSIDDAIWGCTDPSDVSIDTVNRADSMVGSHIS